MRTAHHAPRRARLRAAVLVLVALAALVLLPAPSLTGVVAATEPNWCGSSCNGKDPRPWRS